MHLPVTDVNGKRTVIILEGVYYDPTVKYNLVSMSELAGLNYESRFSRCIFAGTMQGASIHESAGQVQVPARKSSRMQKNAVRIETKCIWIARDDFRMAASGFENLDTDGVTFKKETTKLDGTISKILLTIHVDDAIVATNDYEYYQQFINELGTSFELSASGKLTWFLGCKVEQDLVKGTVRMSQEKYCNDVLKRFKMSDTNAVHTPCEANQHLQASDSLSMEHRDPNVVRDYQQAVGSCMFVTVFTRVDCAFAVNQCARFMANPGPTHITTI